MTIPNTTSASPATDQAATAVARKTNLDSQDFMKLLAVQFQNQDPMSPMDDTAYIAQMAQFTSLSQSSSLLTEIGSLRAEQQRVIAQGYLGARLTVDDGEGGIAAGVVTGIEQADDGPRVVIGDSTYPLSAVLLVERGSQTETQPAA